MTTPLTNIAALRDTPVFDFFRPEETRSCSPVMGVRVADLCRASSIETVGQLADKTADELYALNFGRDLIPYICLQLQRANPDLNLKQAFSPAAGAQGRVAAISVLPSEGIYANPAIRVYGA